MRRARVRGAFHILRGGHSATPAHPPGHVRFRDGMVKAWVGIDGRLLSLAVFAAIFWAPLERLHEFVDDALVLKVIIVLFVVVSIIGTGVVLRCGEVPGDDELFNFGERVGLTPVQQAALQGGHVTRRGAAAAG